MTIKFDVTVHIHVHASGDVVRSIETSLAKLLTLGEKTMTVIGDFAARQREFNDRMDAAISGLTEDIATLNAKILELQTSPGTITPEDQALLDELQARGETISAKLEALNALTPPAPPVS
jgi:hypothetical protein